MAKRITTTPSSISRCRPISSTLRSTPKPTGCNMPRCVPPIGRSSVTPCSTRSTATRAPRSSTCCRACGPRPSPVSRLDGRRWANATTSLERPLPTSPGIITNGTRRIMRRWSWPATSRTPRSLRKPRATSAQFPFPFEIVDLAYAIPGDTQRGEPAISTLSTLLENQRSPFYRALVESNIALAIEANADTQLRGGLLHVFIVLNPGHTASEAQAVFQATLDGALQSGFDPDLVVAAKRLTIAERLYSADSIDGIGGLAGYTYGIVGEKIGDEDDRLTALTGADLVATARTYLRRPTVVGHLTPNESPPRGNSQKNSAAASDDFSKRVPNGPIVEPAWIAKAVSTPTTVRSALSPVEFRLSNGLRVIVQTKSDRPTFVLNGNIASSPGFEPAAKEGIGRLASSAADYGSAQYPFAQRRKATDEMGAFISTGDAFSAQGMSSDFERIVAIIADGEEHPTFSDTWFALERSQLANSLQSESSISD